MALGILIVPDKFKGTLSAGAAAAAMARGWRRGRRGDTIWRMPMSDGGDGFGEVMGALLGAKTERVQTVDAAHRPCASRWWWEPGSRTAIIESAETIGLARLPRGQFHPFELDTFGLGAMIRAAAGAGAKHCLVGIGGSATNDGGFGLARALGWDFLDREGKPIERWTGLDKLERIAAPARRRWFRKLQVAVDVRNRLLGPRGASRVYGPQKGLQAGDFARAERCLQRLARVWQRQSGAALDRVPGSGAAGGLGFGLPAFLGGRVVFGFELFARLARLEKRLRAADCVVTGEGALDASTLMGKGVSRIAQMCRAQGIPCIALAGTIKTPPHRLGLFAAHYALTELTDLTDAKDRPAFWLERLSQKVSRGWGGPPARATHAPRLERTAR